MSSFIHRGFNRFKNCGVGIAGASLPAFTAIHNASTLALIALQLFQRNNTYVQLLKALKLTSIRCLGLLIVWMVVAQMFHPGAWYNLAVPLAKYRKLLWVILLIPVVQQRSTRTVFLYAFVGMCTFTAICWLLSIHHVLLWGLPYIKGGIFKNYLETSVCLAYAAFISALWAARAPVFLNRLFCILQSILLIVAVLLSPGRSGYLCLGLLGAMWMMSHWKKMRHRWIVLLLAILIPINAYYALPVVHTRLHQVMDEWKHYDFKAPSTQDTSLGLRLQFFQHSIQLAQQKPWFGWGVGSFQTAYQTRIGAHQTSTDNAHNEYAMLAVQSGWAALGLFLVFLGLLWRDANALPPFESSALKGLILCMWVGCLINSWLHDTTEGHWFAWMVALCLSTHPKLQTNRRH